MTIETIKGAGAISTARAALEAPGRVGAARRMLTELGWRQETRVCVNDRDLGPASDHVEIDIFSTERCTSVCALRVGEVTVPLKRGTFVVKDMGDHWLVGRDRITVVQTPGEYVGRYNF